MNREVSALGIDSARLLHAEEIGPDDWRMWNTHAAGLWRGGRKAVITQLADLIGEGTVYRLVPPHSVRNGITFRDEFAVDRAGNIWYEDEYLAPHQYLPQLIPAEGDL